MDPERRNITYTLSQVIDEHLLEVFAKDKIGCKYVFACDPISGFRFLQENFPPSGPLSDSMYAQLMSKPDVFLVLKNSESTNRRRSLASFTRCVWEFLCSTPH